MTDMIYRDEEMDRPAVYQPLLPLPTNTTKITEDQVLHWMTWHQLPPPRSFPRDVLHHIVCEITGRRRSNPTGADVVERHVHRLNARAGHPLRRGRPHRL